MTHLSDDDAVAKMGHLILWRGLGLQCIGVQLADAALGAYDEGE